MIEVMTKLTPAKFVTWMQGFLDAHRDSETRGYFLSSNDVVKIREKLDAVDLTEVPPVVNNVTHNHHEKDLPQYRFDSGQVQSASRSARKFVEVLEEMMRPTSRPDCVELSKALEKLGTPYFMAPDSPLSSPVGALKLARGLGMLSPELRDDEAKPFVENVQRFVSHCEKQTQHYILSARLIDKLTPIATTHINRVIKAKGRDIVVDLPVIQRGFIIQWLYALEYEAFDPPAMVVACSTELVKRDDEHVILTLLQFIFDASCNTFDVVGVTDDEFCVIGGKVSRTTNDVAVDDVPDPTDALAPDVHPTEVPKLGTAIKDEDSASQAVKVDAEETAIALGQDILVETRRAPAIYGPGMRCAYYLVDGVRGELFSEVAVPAIPIPEASRDARSDRPQTTDGAGLSVPRHLEADDADESF